MDESASGANLTSPNYAIFLSTPRISIEQMGLKSSGVFANENRTYLAIPRDIIDVDIDEPRVGEKLSDDRSILLSYFAGSHMHLFHRPPL
jgi:hypothetical protein